MTDVDDGVNDFKFEEPEVIDGVNVTDHHEGREEMLNAHEDETLVKHTPRAVDQN